MLPRLRSVLRQTMCRHCVNRGASVCSKVARLGNKETSRRLAPVAPRDHLFHQARLSSTLALTRDDRSECPGYQSYRAALYLRLCPPFKREKHTIPCHFSHYFPFDNHVCKMKLLSRNFPMDQLVLTWRSPPHMSASSTNTPHFIVSEVSSIPCEHRVSAPSTSSYTATYASHSCLAVQLVLTRSLCLAFYRFYIPSSVVLFFAWIAFYVSRTDLVSRLLLLSFSISFQLFVCSSFLQSAAFPLAVATPADVWCALLMIQCIIVAAFLFTSIVMECQVKKYRDLCGDSRCIREDSRSRHERHAMRAAMYRKENNHTEKSACSYAAVVESAFRRKGDAVSLCSARLDIIARITCPVVYIVITSLYFLLYLLSPHK